MSTDGDQLIPFAELERDDIVIVPAFGTTVELFDTLRARGIDPLQYNATCPFVEKVWKRSHQLGERGYTVVIHGKHTHEETRATFSHAQERAPSLVIRDMPEALRLAEFLRGERDLKEFAAVFAGRYTPGFEPTRDLVRIGVVNQTTMLASETEAISDVLRGAMLDRFGRAEDDFHFADTRDTLCYATSENQTSVFGLLEAGGDLAIVVGGYNSSNTSHLAEILAERLPTYYIKDAAEMVSAEVMRHLDVASGRVVETKGWMPTGRATVDILLSAGASCPDTVVDGVITRLAALYGVESRLDGAIRAATAVTR
jgi:4-hydroxy-3-methylbut-2-enyl diphosphate reductase